MDDTFHIQKHVGEYYLFLYNGDHQLSNPSNLLDQFKDAMSEDIAFKNQKLLGLSTCNLILIRYLQ